MYKQKRQENGETETGKKNKCVYFKRQNNNFVYKKTYLRKGKLKRKTDFFNSSTMP